MKKIITLLIILTALTTSTFGADFNMGFGAGGLLGYTFTRYTLEGGGANSFQKMDRFDFGGFLFFDATYAEISIIFQGGNSTWEEKMIRESSSSSLSTDKGTGTVSSLGFSLLGKYPFKIHEKFTLFPMFGLEYHIALIERRKPDRYNNEYSRTKGHERVDRDKDDKPYPNLVPWNSFWIDVGAGVDYFILDRLFLRGELLFGFRLPTGHELGAFEVVKDQFDISDPKIAGLTGGPSLKIAVGYQFY